MKKNIRKIPNTVKTKLRSLNGQPVVVGCAKQFSAEELRNGALAHLGVELRDDGLHLPSTIIPQPSQGKYSRQNVEGFEVIRNDLPLETHYHSIESPNWGDSYNGTHTVDLPYQKYPRDYISPREIELNLHYVSTDATNSHFIISAQINDVLSQSDSDFEGRLLIDLNLMQENLGACGIQPANKSINEYVSTLNLAWDILPPGSNDEAIKRIFRGRTPSKEEVDTANDRLDFFDSLSPKKIVVGSSGFSRYFGALLEDELVVFENAQYGNAVYIMYRDWETLSKLSRVELLTGRLKEQFDRIVHRPGWQDEVKSVVKEKRRALHL